MNADEMRDLLLAVLTEPDSQTYWPWRKGFLDIDKIADALLPIVRKIAADELRAAANEYETDGAIVSALADQARGQSDLASEAAYAITASDFQHIVGRLRGRADALDPS